MNSVEEKHFPCYIHVEYKEESLDQIKDPTLTKFLVVDVRDRRRAMLTVLKNIYGDYLVDQVFSEQWLKDTARDLISSDNSELRGISPYGNGTAEVYLIETLNPFLWEMALIYKSGKVINGKEV